MRWRELVLAASASLVAVTGCATSDDVHEVVDDNPALVAPSGGAATSAAPTTARAVPSTAAAPATTVVPTIPTTTLPPLPVPDPPPLDRGQPGAQVGSIEIPKIHLSLPLFSGVNLATLDEGPGHWPGTALPGQLGNAVVAAHRVSHGGPFRAIDKLAVGDRVTFRLPTGDVTYEVTATDVVPPETIQIIEQTNDKTATLFACHPPGSTKFRYVVKLRMLA